jgi:FAD/FMN-containing dehydrogenase
MPAALAERAVVLTGWARYPAVRSRVQRPEQLTEVVAAVTGAGDRAVLARGAGRSYGDAALNADGTTVLMERLDRILSFDDRTGVVRCEAGVSMQDVLETFVPRGWFPWVTPGTKFVTIGGAVASDVHGKNHHRVGAFGSCVRSLVVVGASGEAVRCSPDHNRDLFQATLGGMGLTGIILEVEFALRRVETAYVVTRTFRARNLEEAIALLDQHDAAYDYSVAWVNGMAEGDRLGESIVSFGNHAAAAELGDRARGHPLEVRTRHRLRVPVDLPSWAISGPAIRAFNALYFARSPGDGTSLADYDAFFYPLDLLHDWNRLYGRKGFVQYQCAVPAEGGPGMLRHVLEQCHRRQIPSALGVLKRFGPPGSWLSFPIPGYTLSLDIPGHDHVLGSLDELDQLVIQVGGRVNLAKDARLSASAFREMYADYPKWLAAKAAVDPRNRFSSVLARRLQLRPS